MERGCTRENASVLAYLADPQSHHPTPHIRSARHKWSRSAREVTTFSIARRASVSAYGSWSRKRPTATITTDGEADHLIPIPVLGMMARDPGALNGDRSQEAVGMAGGQMEGQIQAKEAQHQAPIREAVKEPVLKHLTTP